MSSGAAGAGTDYSTVYVVLGLIILLVIRRMARVFRGTRVSIVRTIGFSIYYGGFAGLLVAVSYSAGGVSIADLVLYVIIGAVGVYGSYVFSNRRIGFWKAADGSVFYKGAVIIYLVYLAAFIARISITLAFMGPQAFTFSFGAAPTLSAAAIDAGIATDFLLCFGSGLLIGRNIRVIKRYRLITAGKEEVSDVIPKIRYL